MKYEITMRTGHPWTSEDGFWPLSNKKFCSYKAAMKYLNKHFPSAVKSMYKKNSKVRIKKA